MVQYFMWPFSKANSSDTLENTIGYLDTGKVFSKVKFSLVILTTFEFSRQNLETKLLENDAFQSIPNLKWWIFDNFNCEKIYFLPNLTSWNVNFSEKLHVILAGKFKWGWNQSEKYWLLIKILLYRWCHQVWYSHCYIGNFTIFEYHRTTHWSFYPHPGWWGRSSYGMWNDHALSLGQTQHHQDCHGRGSHATESGNL